MQIVFGVRSLDGSGSVREGKASRADCWDNAAMKILLFGPSGQLGRALARSLGALGEVIGCDRSCVDLADLGKPARLAAALARQAPQVVVNAAAFTAVDRAESEPALAMAVNGAAPGLLAAAARAAGALFVHYSTDHVFDGSGQAGRDERAPPAPLNAYGRSKLAGEQAVARAGGDWLVLRTSWLYSAHGHNFVTTMLRLGAERETIRVVDDQVGAPTTAALVAVATTEIVRQALAERSRRRFASELLHLCAAGETSRHGFAEAIFDGWRTRAGADSLRVRELLAVSSSAYPAAAARPLNSRLDCTRVRERFGLRLPDWRKGLAEVLDELAGDRSIRSSPVRDGRPAPDV